MAAHRRAGSGALSWYKIIGGWNGDGDARDNREQDHFDRLEPLLTVPLVVVEPVVVSTSKSFR